MDFDKVINMRYSVRKFSDKKVEKEKIDKLLMAVNLAPSARNSQATRVIVVQDTIDKMNELTKCVFGGNVLFIICAKKDNLVTRKYGEIDASIALTHLVLAASNEGLGTCIVGMFDREKTTEYFKMEEDLVPLLFVTCGYPSDDSKPIDLHYNRKDISEIAFKESLENKYER
ncbi:nitroreductase family protein [Acholeplasma sp. OttesenSCG-928-E16]|nr:nitroreductase family protein [Acholeplasma sp. OttesenSCG-928-E16]